MYISPHIQYWCDVALICASLSLLVRVLQRKHNQLAGYVYIYLWKRSILRNWLRRLWRPSSPKSAGWAGRLKTQSNVTDKACRPSTGRIPSCSEEFRHLFYTFLRLVGWGPSTLEGQYVLLKVHRLKCKSHPQIPFQSHRE